MGGKNEIIIIVVSFHNSNMYRENVITQKCDLDSNKAVVGSSQCCAWPPSPNRLYRVVRVTIRHRFHPITFSHFLCLHPITQSIKTLSPSAVFLAIISHTSLLLKPHNDHTGLQHVRSSQYKKNPLYHQQS